MLVEILLWFVCQVPRVIHCGILIVFGTIYVSRLTFDITSREVYNVDVYSRTFMGFKIITHWQPLCLFRLLFPGPHQKELSQELFKVSGVDETLRAQQLSMIQFGQLCYAYQSLREDIENRSFQEGKCDTS